MKPCEDPKCCYQMIADTDITKNLLWQRGYNDCMFDTWEKIVAAKKEIQEKQAAVGDPSESYGMELALKILDNHMTRKETT